MKTIVLTTTACFSFAMLAMELPESKKKSMIDFYSGIQKEYYDTLPDEIKKITSIDILMPQLINRPWHYAEHVIPRGALAVSFADNDLLLSADIDYVNLFDYKIGEEVFSTWYERFGGFPNVCFDRAGKRLIVIANRQGYIADLSLQKPRIMLTGEVCMDTKIDMSINYNDTLLILKGYISPTYNFNLATGEFQEFYGYGPNGCVRLLCFSPIESYYAFVNEKNQVVISEDRKSKLFKTHAIISQNSFIEKICFNHDGTQLAVGLESGELHILDFPSGSLLWSVFTKGSVWAICFDSTGKRLAVGSNPYNNKKQWTYIFTHYDDYTLEQLMLRKIMHWWLLVKKPDGDLSSIKKIVKNISCLFKLNAKELYCIWKSFPEYMQIAIEETMCARIKKYRIPKKSYVKKGKEKSKKYYQKYMALKK